MKVRKTMNNDNTGCNITIGGGCLTAILFSWWTDRTVDFWCSYYFGHNVDIPFIWSFLLTLFGNVLVLLCNIVSEIARICVGG